MDEENLQETQKKTSSSNSVQQTTQNIQQVQKAMKNIEKGKKVAQSSKFITAIGPLLPYIGIALVILLAIIFMIGIIVFLITMPGMVMEKLKAMFNEFGNAIAAFFGADTAAQIEPEEVYEVLDYLEDMGYDLKGYGFLTSIMDEDDIENGKESVQKVDSGIIRDTETGKIVKAESGFILRYIMSDNYIYTVKNYNMTNSWANAEGFWNKLWGGIVALGQHLANILMDGGDAWGKGMIYLMTEGGSEWTDKSIVDLDPKTKMLTITAPGTNKRFDYSVEGWTGRYGMPLEFLLSIHIATNMPDLAYEMVGEFETQVNIKLKNVTVSVDSYYRDPNTGTDIVLGDLLDACSMWTSAEKDIVRVFDLGLTSPEDCEGAIDHKGNTVKCSDIDGTEEEPGITETEYNELSEEDKNKYRLDSDDGLYYCGNGKACAVCGQYLRDIKTELGTVQLGATSSYIPYISSVENHWFRNVYFELDEDINIITNDDEYEALMKERWTLYETDENGFEILYVLDDEGNLTDEVFNGTKRDALDQGIAVAKKPKITDEFKSGWTAYEDSDEVSRSDKEQMYPEEDGIKGNVYVQSSFTGLKNQKEEAIRGETNSTIKDMFSNRYYFKYDGNQDTAEVILALREQLSDNPDKPVYGELSDADRDKSFDLVVNKKAEATYKVKDYASRVDLNKDSLSAFSMLENTHTVDSDYIYKDFKELIVELGYFEKEDLTNSVPEIFQWFIPEIGSYGFPKRAYDKKENMFGTMAHSKGDYDALSARDIHARYESFKAEMAKGNEGYVFEEPEYTPMSGLSGLNTGDLTEVSAVRLDGVNIRDIKRVVGAADTLKDPSEVSVEEFLQKAAEVHARMEGNFWEYCAAGMHSGEATRHTSDGSCPGNYSTFEASNNAGKTADCSSYVSWVLQEVGIIDAKYTSSGMYGALKEYILTKSEAGSLQPGDILLSDGHVQINGEENTQYNAGSTNAIQQPPKKYLPDFYTHVIRLPFEGTENGESYKGFEGGEAVVSPATGILLEYGTYEGQTSTETNESGPFVEKGERLNYDLMYPYAGLTGTGGALDSADSSAIIQESREVYDKVGYAKILVLDYQNYLLLEDSIGTSAFGGSLYDTSRNNFRNVIETEEVIEDLSEDEQLLYAFKEFVEKYESFDLGGYVIYLDGFKCELPNPEKNEDDENPVLGSGIELSMDYFKNNASTYEESLYRKDETFNYTNKDIKERVDAENKLKNASKPLYYDSANDLLFIKEGTVIGRTFSDKELVEDLRGETYVDVNEYNANRPEGEEEKVPDVLGNYLRITLKDNNDDIVENVEDYLKLDDTKPDLDTDWVLFYWLPFESGGTDIEGCGPESQGTCSEGETAVGIIQWTVLIRGDKKMNNIAGQFIPGCLERDPDLCAPLEKYKNWTADQFWEDYKGAKLFKATLSQICDTNRDAFLKIQMDVAKEQYYEPIIEAHPWVEQLPTCVQAEILHLRVWGASIDDLDAHQGDSPEALLAYVRHKIANTSSTAGEATGNEEAGRAFNEPEIGYGILDGRLSEDDVEEWVRNADVSVLTKNGVEYR